MGDLLILDDIVQNSSFIGLKIPNRNIFAVGDGVVKHL